MDTQTNKPSTHPIMVIAAVAVVLFCGVGSAALLGWLPTSNATVPDKVAGMPPAPAFFFGTSATMAVGPQSHGRVIGRLFGNGIGAVIGDSSAPADARAFAARLRIASAAFW